MAIIREFGRHAYAFGQKLTSENIHNFGQKALHAGRVIGRKMTNTLSKVESVANAVLLGLKKLRARQDMVQR